MPVTWRCYLAGMSPNRILLLGALALLLYLSFSYGLRTFFPRLAVEYDTALTGRVTGTFQVRSEYTFFLNSQKTPRYDFDAFAPVPRAGQEQPEGTRLGQYLREGDFVRKPGHATMLTVQRGDSLTQWVCPPPAATPTQ